MSSSKAALKSINDAIRKQSFDDAIEKAEEFLKNEPKNYQSHIFLAFALDKRNRLDEAEKVYRAATQFRPKDPQAWQGLVKLYEKQGPKRLPDYQQVVINLVPLLHEAEENYKCHDVVDKYIDLARVQGDKVQYAEALWIRLPECPLYSILEGYFPAPAKTYEQIAVMLEEFEKKRINNLIGERRTRLGAKLSEVTLEVRREVYSQSRLEHIYRQLINWTNDDDVRRTYEEKLLQYCYDRLLATPVGDLKTQERETVFGLANDMVLIRHPFKLAWNIAIDWQDKKQVKDWDPAVLKKYCDFFPESDLYKVIMAFLTSQISPFGPVEQLQPDAAVPSGSEGSDDDDEDGGVPTSVIPYTEEERLLMISEGISTADSIFAYRVVGQFFVHAGEYETAVEFTRKGLQHLAAERKSIGLGLLNSEDDVCLSLGTALVYYQSPRHHKEAKDLFDKILDHDSTSTPALIGVGLIFEEEEEHDQAIDFFSRALDRDSTNLRVRSEAAWVRALKGDWQTAKDELQPCLEQLGKQKQPEKDLLADVQYRLGVCLWNLDTSRAARKQRKGDSAYALWLGALTSNLNHAPTYTSLGIFYGDYAKDKKRSRRCFQKALELSPSEVIAADRLARSFADDGDWDRVELVAQRVVNSGKVKPPPGSKRKGISWPFAALGVAELNKQDYHKAIVSFQSALRITPEDYHSWVGLGESYHSSGRYIAATKAILNAQRLEDEGKVDDVNGAWFTKYILANVKRDLGDYDESIALYQAVMSSHPNEEGVILAFMQTMVDNALTSIELGLFGKAVQLATDIIEFAAEAPEGVLETFNFWKSLGDACSIYTYVQSHLSSFPKDLVRSILEKSSKKGFDTFASADKIGAELPLENGSGGDSPISDVRTCLHATLLCQKQAIYVSRGDLHAQAVAHYNLGWAEHRAHTSLPLDQREKSSPYLRAAVRAFKRAIELEAGNSEFWNALGVVTSTISPSVSQHAFVRSLHLNERNPLGWTNLGTLALLSGDVKLANSIFTRAQSTDPDYAHAWLGQGFVALMKGDAKEARGLFAHAMEISDSSSLPTRRHYASSMFDHILTAPPNLSMSGLIQPLFALNQIQSMRPQDLEFGQLSALFQERTREGTRSVQTLKKINSILETDYEKTESPESLARFTLAKTDLARAYLAARSYEEAVDCGETALGLSSDDADNELTREQRRKARLSAHLTVGLAQYYRNKFEDALQCFESALEESDQNPDATCLLAQVLWAEGSESSRDRARTALFEVIEKHPNHVQSILLLGVVALLDKDEDSLEAVMEELQGLRYNDKVTSTEQSHTSEVLRAIATLGEGKTEADVRAQIQTDIMLYPNLPHGWSSMAKATGDVYSAQMALQVARRGIPPRGVLEAQDLAGAYAGTGLAADAQRAAFLAPWQEKSWTALAAATEGI